MTSIPTTNYEMFRNAILNEIARCVHMPSNKALADSSRYNYSSGRLDHQTYSDRGCGERRFRALSEVASFQVAESLRDSRVSSGAFRVSERRVYNRGRISLRFGNSDRGDGERRFRALSEVASFQVAESLRYSRVSSGAFRVSERRVYNRGRISLGFGNYDRG
jgi:hypothetical protein